MDVKKSCQLFSLFYFLAELLTFPAFHFFYFATGASFFDFPSFFSLFLTGAADLERETNFWGVYLWPPRRRRPRARKNFWGHFIPLFLVFGEFDGHFSGTFFRRFF